MNTSHNISYYSRVVIPCQLDSIQSSPSFISNSTISNSVSLPSFLALSHPTPSIIFIRPAPVTIAVVRSMLLNHFSLPIPESLGHQIIPNHPSISLLNNQCLKSSNHGSSDPSTKQRPKMSKLRSGGEQSRPERDRDNMILE